MLTTRLTLRVRIFMFFAVLMVAGPLSIGMAIWLAHASNSDDLPRILATYAGVSALVMLLLTMWIWQLFDKHVAAALQSLARQMQTAMHADTDGLHDTQPFQYLGPVSDAANELIRAYNELKQHSRMLTGSGAGTSIETQQLAAILHDLDVGVMVMNLHHRILLYNQRAACVLQHPERLGLARSADLLFKGHCLARQIESQLLTVNDSQRKIKLQLVAVSTSQLLNAKACLVSGDDNQASGYVLVFDDPAQPDADIVNPETRINTETCSPVTAGTAGKRSGTSRPHFYDFDLFHRKPSVEMQNQSLTTADYVVFDTETTGLNPSGGDEMISIAAVRLVNGRIVAGEYFDELINPGRPVPARSTVFHGITDDMLVGRPTIDEVLPRFEQFVEDAILVAHNAAFDMKFIELKKTQCQIELTNPVLDTVLLSAWLHDHTHKHTLDDLAARFGLTINNRHSAMGDAMATAQIFCRLLEQLSARGVDTLAEALAISDKMTHIKKQQKVY